MLIFVLRGAEFFYFERTGEYLEKEHRTRRKFLWFLGPFFGLLVKLTGCGGGGGGPQTGSQATPGTQQQYKFFVSIAGVPSLVIMANANPTVLEVTQQTAQIDTVTRSGKTGVFVWSISGIDGHFDHPGPDWIFEVNGQRIDNKDTAADTVLLNPNDQLTWKLI